MQIITTAKTFFKLITFGETAPINPVSLRNPLGNYI